MTNVRIASVRRFNRFYTKQMGLLDEGLLRSPFTLAEVRVLYEIASSADVSAVDLASRLLLDPGYLSRILLRFQKLGLLLRKQSADDGRRSLLTLTEKGQRTFATLKERQEKDIAMLLARVSVTGQRQLLKSMRVIEEVLGAPTAPATAYLVRRHRPGDMGWITHRQGLLYWEEHRYDERFEALAAKIVAAFIEHLEPARERCWVAERGGEIVGSVFLVKESATVAKLRLLYVEPAARGLGIGTRLVNDCVQFARKAGYRKITLWTQSELQAARQLYEKAGFTIVARKPHKSFGRSDLVAETWELRL